MGGGGGEGGVHTCNESVMLGIKKHARDAFFSWPHFIVCKYLK